MMLKYTFSLALLFLLASCSGLSNCPCQGKPSIEQTPAAASPELEVTELRAKVQFIAYKRRLITLQFPDGKTAVLKVSNDVKRFNEIKPGDFVVARYYESLAFEVREPTPEEKRKPKTAVQVAANARPDLPPAAAALNVLQAIVTVKSVDLNNSTLTVKEPEGNVVTLRSSDPSNLEQLKVGDTIAVTYTEALAISLEPHKL